MGTPDWWCFSVLFLYYSGYIGFFWWTKDMFKPVPSQLQQPLIEQSYGEVEL